MTVDDGRYVGISEVAESTGFSLDTLRWYEREGLFPRVERDSSRRRRTPAAPARPVPARRTKPARQRQATRALGRAVAP